MTVNFVRRTAIICLLFGVSACGELGTGSQYEPGPVGTGTSVQELKATPCACAEIPMQFPEGFGYEEYRASGEFFLNSDDMIDIRSV